jgi:SOS response regulatory protein OraA/RecX
VVTALRKTGRDCIAVELDGRAWRILPAEAVLAAGLSAGVTLDRERARRLGRHLRRVQARAAALSALSRSDQTVTTLRRRLAARGVAPADREGALETVQRAGLVDDARFAAGRARALAARGAGDALIRDDLERRGVAAELVTEAIAGLERESERAGRLLGAHGCSPRTLRRLAAKGFSQETIEALVADQPDAELG